MFIFHHHSIYLYGDDFFGIQGDLKWTDQ